MRRRTGKTWRFGFPWHFSFTARSNRRRPLSCTTSGLSSSARPSPMLPTSGYLGRIAVTQSRVDTSSLPRTKTTFIRLFTIVMVKKKEENMVTHDELYDRMLKITRLPPSGWERTCLGSNNRQGFSRPKFGNQPNGLSSMHVCSGYGEGGGTRFWLYSASSWMMYWSSNKITRHARKYNIEFKFNNRG